MKFFLPIAAAVASVAMPAQAATFYTTLSGANETVPNASTATGTGTLVLSADQNTVDIFLNWAGLTGPAVGAHIHCCAAQGADGPVAIDFGPPSLATGSLTRNYNLASRTIYGAGFISANGGASATGDSLRAVFLTGLLGGRAYYNVHTSTFPRGEIRGQLAPVPETATWGMMIAGFGIVGGAMRLQRRKAAIA